MDSPAQRGRRKASQRAVPQSVRRSGRPLFFGWGAHLTHHEREQVKERIAAGIAVVLALAIIGILVNGWYQDNVVKPGAAAARRNAPAARIGSTVITNGWYHTVLKLRQNILKSQLTTYQNDAASLSSSKSKNAQAQLQALQQLVSQLQSQQASAPTTTLQELIDSAVIAQRGPSAGLHLKKAAEQKFLATTIKKNYQDVRHFALTAKDNGMTVKQYKGLLLDDYRHQQMQKVLAAKVKTTGIQAHVRHILLSVPSATQKATLPHGKYAKLVHAKAKLAKKIAKELRAGAGWKKLALKYSSDGTKTTGSRAKGGDLGWQFTSGYVPPFRHAADTQSIGAIRVVRSQFGFHVMEVLGRRKARLPASQLASKKQQALQNWLNKQEANKRYVVRYIHPTVSSLPGSGLPSGLPGSSLPGSAPGSAPPGSTGPSQAPGLPTGPQGSTGSNPSGSSGNGSGSGKK